MGDFLLYEIFHYLFDGCIEQKLCQDNTTNYVESSSDYYNLFILNILSGYHDYVEDKIINSLDEN